MVSRAIVFLGAVLLGLMLLMQRPTPMAIAPSGVQPDNASASAAG